ncbi:endonuclease/exonuclease/phosphatase family protein [Cereibacter changlensis]|uniref:endonuclease/exonuclease/phosphatase family protein n=1 Tax=Cereibacter changlensis TaxID=402884 RepID=UPI003D154B6B
MLQACLIAFCLPLAVAGETLRIATWNAALTRDGPGLLLRDMERGDDPQLLAVERMLAALDADVLLLTGIDYDLGLVALRQLADRLAGQGLAYPHRFALRPNSGRPTGLDLDLDGRRGGPRDAQGYGRFSGEAGMAILSRLPIDTAAVRDFSGLLWRDLPGSLSPDEGEARALQRLSTTGHWEAPLRLPGGGSLRLLAWYATPPVFDGPEDRNGRRNHDEAAFWRLLLDARLPMPPPPPPFVILGDANLDPEDGEGLRQGLAALLVHPALQDPRPRGRGGHHDPGQRGDPALDTADFTAKEGPGHLRVDLVLPSADLQVAGSGVLWPPPGDPLAAVAATASRHRPVWVDILLP